MNKIIQGDCLAVMKSMPTNSVDSIVSDPPAGISFMGKDWDNKGDLNRFQEFIYETFKEALRVLKPGGHALIWAIPRTSHHTAMGLERAGFEIRDCVYHIFGSGFPKSHNIGKSLDKLQGNEREDLGKNKNHRTLKETNCMVGEPHSGDGSLTKGSSPYEGWGTALKPAVECWWLCRKPLEEKTVASNVLKYGTGGINIEKCRVAHQSEADRLSATPQGKVIRNNFKPGETPEGTETNRPDTSQGRFPSNLILDGSDEVVSKFPNSKSGNGKATTYDKSGGQWGKGKQIRNADFGDSGSASRFFYCAKSSKSERNKGLEELFVLKEKIPEDDLNEIKHLLSI